jgi:hypothetical protein
VYHPSDGGVALQIDLRRCPVKASKKPTSGLHTASLPVDPGWRPAKQQAVSIHLEAELTLMVRVGDAMGDRRAEHRSYG